MTEHFHLQIALIRSPPLTWQDERVHASAVKQSRCCSGKGSYWGCRTQRPPSVAGGSSAEWASVERCPGCPETQTCRRRGASCRLKGDGEEVCCMNTKTATLAFSGGRKWAPCKRCCSADGSSCCRSAAGSFSSSPPKSAAFPAQPWTKTEPCVSSPRLDRSKRWRLNWGQQMAGFWLVRLGHWPWVCLLAPANVGVEKDFALWKTQRTEYTCIWLSNFSVLISFVCMSAGNFMQTVMDMD